MAVKIIIRHDSASNWTSVNPTLSLGELGFDTDSKKYKLGDGSTAWNSLAYAGLTATEINSAISTAISNLIDAAPGTLDTLNELAAALGDNPQLFQDVIDLGTDLNNLGTTVNGINSELGDHEGAITNVHGITDTRDLVYETHMVDAINTHRQDTTDVHGIMDTSVVALTTSPTFTGTVVLPVDTNIGIDGGGSIGSTTFSLLSDLTATASELNVLDGITATTSELNLLDGVTATTAELNVLDGLFSTTTQLNYLSTTTSDVQTQIDTKAPSNDPTFTGTVGLPGTTSIGDVSSTEISYVNGVTSAIQTQLDAKASSTDLSTHESDTTNIHGIADTAALATMSYADGTVSDHNSETTGVHGIANTAALETQTGAQTKADNAQTAANTYTDTSINALTTSDIEEGTNLYFTDERAQDAVGSNVGDGLAYNDTSAVISVETGAGLQIDGLGAIEIDSTVATLSGTQALTNKTIDTADNSITVVAADISDVTASAAELNILDGATLTTTELNYVDGVTSAIQTQLDSKAPTANPTFTGTVNAAAITIDGDLYVGGTTITVNSKDYTVRDNMLYMNQAGAFAITNAVGDGTYVTYTAVGHDYEVGDYIVVTDVTPSSFNIAGSANKTIYSVATDTFTVESTVTDTYTSGGTARGKSAANPDLGFAAGYNDGTYHHTGLFRDATDGTWKFFHEYTPEPDTSVFIDTSHASFALAPIAAASVAVSSATIGDVSNTEIQYLNGVTSAVQTQIDSKQATITGAATSITSSDLTASRALTSDGSGKVAVTSVTTTELGYVSGVTSAIQTQLDGKEATITGGASSIVSTDLTSARALVSGSVGKVEVSSVLSSELEYVSGVTSSIQDQLDDKAPINAPTFTGAVTVSASGVVFTDATQTKAGVPSITTITQQTSSYTLASLSERDTIIEIDSTSPTTLTIPLDSATNYPVGTTLDIIQTNTGQVTIAGDSGVTVNATPGLKLRTRWSSATLLKRANNTWLVFGDLSA